MLCHMNAMPCEWSNAMSYKATLDRDFNMVKKIEHT